MDRRPTTFRVPRALAGSVRCVAIAVAVVSSGHAEPAQVAITTEYRAAPGCPDEPTFLERVRARTPRARRAEPSERATVLRVEVSSSADESSGTLVVSDEAGTGTERTVTGDTCDEVVSALALVAALTIDPDAAMSAREPPPSAPPPQTAVASIPPPATSSPVRDTPRRLATRAPRFSFSAGVASAGGLAPSSLFGVLGGVELDFARPRGPSPVIRLGAFRGSADVNDAAGAGASFSATLGVLDACPHRWKIGALAAEPCLRLSVGVADASGVDIQPRRTDVRAWGGAGLIARIRYFLVAPVFLFVEGGVEAAFRRTTYYFEPDHVVYDSPLLGGRIAAGVGARFL